jgi:hypothetical protein
MEPDAALLAVTVRDLRRQPALAPGHPNGDSLLRAFQSLLLATASGLLPQSATGRIAAAAALRSYALRWRRLPRRTLVATWLFRSTCFAVRRERRRLNLPARASDGSPDQWVWIELSRLPVRLLNPLLLQAVLHQTLPTAARALRTKEARVEKLLWRGLRRLGKALRRRGVTTDPRQLLAALVPSAADPTVSSASEELATGNAGPEEAALVKAIGWSWRWVRLKRFLRRGLVSLGVFVCILAAAGVTLKWLADQGYLTTLFIMHFSRQLAKDVPELAQPARPWPKPGEPVPLATAPTTSAELYALTNIWPCRLTFTAEQWHRIAPAHVHPANLRSPDGQMTLRNPKARRSGLAGVLGLDFNWTESRLDFGSLTFGKVAVRYRGNGTYLNSLYGPKQSFKVEVNKVDKTQRVAGVRTLNFVNAIPDFSYVHDALAERLFRDLGVPSPRTSYAYLTVDAPGRFANQPLGLYVLIENIDEDFAADRFRSKRTPIFKPVTMDLFKDLGQTWEDYAAIYDLKNHATPSQLARVVQFAQLVTHADDAEFARRLPEFLDLEEFAGFVAGHVLLSAYDGFLTNGQNFYMYLDPHSNRFGFIPWDHDHSWGEFGYVATADRRERASIWQPSAYHDRFLERVMKVEAFRSLYRQCLERALKDLFTTERLYAQIDQVGALIRPAVAAESDFRLRRFDLALSTNWVAGPRDGAPEGPKAPVHQMKRFIANRIKSVRDQLDGTSTGVILAGH